MEIFLSICSFLTALGTIALAFFAFQAKDSFLNQELYNFGWNFLQEYQSYKEWFLLNLKSLNKELDTEYTDIALEGYNKFQNIERYFLRLNFMTDESFFKKTKKQIDMMDKVLMQYYSKDNSENAKKLRDNIVSDLIKNNVAIEDFLEFLHTKIKTKKLSKHINKYKTQKAK